MAHGGEGWRGRGQIPLKSYGIISPKPTSSELQPTGVDPRWKKTAGMQINSCDSNSDISGDCRITRIIFCKIIGNAYHNLYSDTLHI